MAPILLYHEEMQPMTVVKVLEQHFRYKCRQVRKCQADVLLCHEKGQTSSALAFLFLKCGQLPQRSTTMEQFWTRLERCKRLFAKSFVLLQTDAMDDPVVLNEIQLAMGQRAPSVGFFSTTTDAISMAQLLVHLRHQHEIQQEEFTIFAFHQIQQQVFTYETALKISSETGLKMQEYTQAVHKAEEYELGKH